MHPTLHEHLRRLRLSGATASLEVRLQEALANQLPHAQFLELLLQDELMVRQQRMIDRRKKAAGFRDHRTLEDFDFRFNPSISRAEIYDLASGQFIRQGRDVHGEAGAGGPGELAGGLGVGAWAGGGAGLDRADGGDAVYLDRGDDPLGGQVLGD